MDKFIWISGSINSGKSTIARLLCDKIENGINIELDVLSHFDNKLSIDKKANFIIQDGLDLAKNWINRKCMPILNWPLWGDEAAFMLAYSKKLNLEPIIINLIPGIETVKKNRGERALTEWELNRIDYMYNAGNINNPQHGIKIDNSGLTTSETIDKIMILLNNDVNQTTIH
jgi:hypothetical protein